MSIQQNMADIMNIIKQRKALSIAEFSAELGISCLTLQEYLNAQGNPTKLYNQGTMTFYAHENVENLGVYIFSCSFTRALICGKIIINDVVSVQPQKEIEMKTTDINKVRYTNRWRIVYGICNN